MEKSTGRKTKQLEVVWHEVADDTSHPTADQIYDRVRKQIPNISLGTVYRNLQKLVAEGKLQVLTLGRTQHFDPLVDRHQHFICESCGRVYDVFVGEDEEILPSSLPRGGFTVTSHQLAFYGACKSCSE
ncbi:MAG: transcriptional repressor [Deltaproteobacteria bacterium]|nr:transcriptional repressor [Deltaproteobacteria bacterium]